MHTAECRSMADILRTGAVKYGLLKEDRWAWENLKHREEDSESIKARAHTKTTPELNHFQYIWVKLT